MRALPAPWKSMSYSERPSPAITGADESRTALHVPWCPCACTRLLPSRFSQEKRGPRPRALPLGPWATATASRGTRKNQVLITHRPDRVAYARFRASRRAAASVVACRSRRFAHPTPDATPAHRTRRPRRADRTRARQPEVRRCWAHNGKPDRHKRREGRVPRPPRDALAARRTARGEGEQQQHPTPSMRGRASSSRR